MKTVLITGSTGFVGSNLVKLLSEKGNYNIIGAVEDPSGFTDKYLCNTFVRTISNEELLLKGIEGVDTVVNCAFARSNDPFLLANALDFTTELSVSLKRCNIKSLINISSQGVYKRLCSKELQTEESEIEPIDMYSMAKYAAEKIMISSECATSITSVRLASVNMKQRFLYAFVKNVFLGKKIVLTNPNQFAALLDVSDAVNGIKSLIDLPTDCIKEIYNLGTGNQMTISNYAQIVIKTMKRFGYEGQIEYDNKSLQVKNSGMDCSKIMNQTGWKPIVSVEKMIEKYYWELKNGEIEK